MKLRLENGKTIRTDNYFDISLALEDKAEKANAWYCDPVKIEPVMTDQFIGDVNLGGAVNFRNITFNPHGNGTHTECVGHISKEPYSINQCLKEFFHHALLVTLNCESIYNKEYDCYDDVITATAIQKALHNIKAPCLIIRTLPNSTDKLTRQYSNTNPPYVDVEAVKHLNKAGVEHLIIDLPSVDRESDKGALATHHAFWQYPINPQTQKTITELVFIEDSIPDGEYFVNIQIASIENDASPSKILLFPME